METFIKVMQTIYDLRMPILIAGIFVLWILAIIYEKKLNGKLYFEIEAEKKAKKAAKEEKKRRQEAQRWWYQ